MASSAHSKFRWATMVPTGCKRIGKLKRTCRRIRIPARIFPCSIEEKLTKVTDKDGYIVRFPGRCPKFLEDGVMLRPHDPYEFADRVDEELRNLREGFASHPLP